jgi:hypothetical protein
MMPVKSFIISFRKLYDSKQYHANVEVVAETKHVYRIKVTAGTKELLLVKYKFRKQNAWKVINTNFQMLDTGKVNTQLMSDIIEAVNEGLK